MKQSIVCRFVVVYAEHASGVSVAMHGANSPFNIPIPYDRFKQLMHDPSVTEIEFETAD